MTDPDRVDAVVIGSGPNGLVAAIALARKGWAVTVCERAAVAGGAVRSEALTLSGFVHDPFSAFYGLLHASPVFSDLGLGERLEWAHFDTPVAACVAPGDAAFIHRDLERTVAGLGPDGEAWRTLHEWWSRIGVRFFAASIAPLPSVGPGLRFLRATGARGALSAARMLLAPIDETARARFARETARVLVAAGSSHSDLGVDQTASAPGALILAMLAQDRGMPVPVGGAGRLAEALAGVLADAGGRIRTGDAVTGVIVERGRALGVETASGGIVLARHAVLADTAPGALFLDLVGEEHLPAGFLDGLRAFRHGTGIFKVDLALNGAVPWTAAGLDRTGVVHLMGDLHDMARAAHDARHGLLPMRPLLIVGQQSVADPSRAPAGRHTLWIETHVPPDPRGDGSGDRALSGWGDAREPFLERVLSRLEDHAPGLRARIVGTSVRTPPDLEAENPNLVGGDIGGGSSALHQQLVFRPVPGWFRYRTPVKRLYLCSASAHPGGGVHGMVGRNCARRVLRDARRPSAIARTAGGGRRRPRRVVT